MMTDREKAFVMNGLRCMLQIVAECNGVDPAALDRDLMLFAMQNGLERRLLEETRVEALQILEAATRFERP